MRLAWTLLAASVGLLASGRAPAQESGPLPFNPSTVPRLSLPTGAPVGTTWPSPLRMGGAYDSVFDTIFQGYRSITEAPPQGLPAVGQPAPLDTLISPAQPPSWVGPGVPPDARFGVPIGPVQLAPRVYAVPPPVAGDGRLQQSVLPSIVIPFP